MAIPPWECFHYIAELSAAGMSSDAIVLDARCAVPSNEATLVGPCPRLRFSGELLAMEASTSNQASMHRVSFVVGDAVMRVAQAGDTLHALCTYAGDLALSILRGHSLVFAVGAVAEVPLGAEVRAVNRRRPGEETSDWLEVTTPDGRRRLAPRESARVGPYDVYVERTRARHGAEGAESASIVQHGDIAVVNAAVRAAVLIGSGALAAPRWQDWSGQFR